MTIQPHDSAAPVLVPIPAPTQLLKRWRGALLMAAWVLGSIGPTQAANNAPPPQPTASASASALPCDAAAAAMPVEQLVGLWQLTLWPTSGSPKTPVSQGAILFQAHPEYPGSVRGRLKRSGPGNDLQAVLSGDVVDGEFNLDESDDGVRMSATWVGTPFDCGTRLRGERELSQAAEDEHTVLQFELRKAAE